MIAGASLGARRWLVSLCAALLAASALAGCQGSDADAADAAARAQTLLDARRYGEARLAIRDAIAVRDDEPQFHILRGRIEVAAGSIAAAYDAYSDAMSLDPANREALEAVSQLGLQTGHLRESLEATEVLLSLAPDDTSALLVRGLHAVIRSRFDEADGYADRILALDAADEGGVILKARVAVRKGSPEKALEILADYGPTRPDTAGVAMTRLEIYRVLRDAAGMRRQFALLRKLAADNRDLRLDEANFAFKDGRPAIAQALLTSMLADPKQPTEKIGDIMAVWREYLSSESGSEAVAAIAASGTATARISVAEYLIDNGRIADAETLLQGLPMPDRAAADAAIAARQGRWDDALGAAEAILADDNTHCLALTVRAEALLEGNNPSGALQSAQLAASQCPGRLAPWEIAAKAYARRNDMQNARRMWRQGVKSNPQNSVISEKYVDWLMTEGQNREALAVARRLTHAAPSLLSGWRVYLQACERVDKNCVAEARAGLADASTAFGIDLLPGEPPPNGLFGRIVTR